MPSLASRDSGIRPHQPTARDIPQHSMFEATMNLDVTTILLLLGESTIWTAVWSRFRFRRWHWTHMVFATSLGWAPLAATVFASMEGRRGPPNLIFDRIPEGVRSSGLLLTNLNSGATHEANHAVLQNIWQAWYRGPREYHQKKLGKQYDVTRECGLVDVDVSKLALGFSWSLKLQATCLVAQLVVGIVLAVTDHTLETLVSLGITLAGQWLLLWAVTPSKKAWNGRDLTVHRPAPVMLHRGLNSSAVLIIRSSRAEDKAFSLEEFTFESQAIRDTTDRWRMVAAGCAFMIFLVQVMLVGWMQPVNRIAYCALNTMGLVANALEGSIQPNWLAIYERAFEGVAFCEPRSSTLMATVGLLLGAKFPASTTAAKLLYPDNTRFAGSLLEIQGIFDQILCKVCRSKFSDATAGGRPCQVIGGPVCSNALRQVLAHGEIAAMSKQTKDAVAACVKFLESAKGDEIKTRVTGKFDYYHWKSE